MKSVLLFIIRLYQKKSLFSSGRNTPNCRFYPSCSEYAYQSIQRYGTIKGSFWALTRILRCHPLSKGGFDPVD